MTTKKSLTHVSSFEALYQASIGNLVLLLIRAVSIGRFAVSGTDGYFSKDSKGSRGNGFNPLSFPDDVGPMYNIELVVAMTLNGYHAGGKLFGGGNGLAI